MTRKEQIKQAAQAYYPQGTLHEEKAVSAFIRGAKWADGCPEFSKEEFIEKACKWLEQHVNDDKYYSYIGQETKNNITNTILTMKELKCPKCGSIHIFTKESMFTTLFQCLKCGFEWRP